MSLSGWRKLAVTLGAILYLEIGSRLTLPGVNANALANYFNAAGKGGLLGLYDLIGGGGLSRGAVLALGILPYLTALVNVRLLRIVSPGMEALTRTSTGREKLKWITRGITVAAALAQSVGFAAFVRKVPGVVTNPGQFMTTTILTLTAGSLIAMWFGEQLAERDEPEMSLSEMPGRPEGAPALSEPAQPASQPIHPRPASDPGTARTRR